MFKVLFVFSQFLKVLINQKQCHFPTASCWKFNQVFCGTQNFGHSFHRFSDISDRLVRISYKARVCKHLSDFFSAARWKRASIKLGKDLGPGSYMDQRFESLDFLAKSFGNRKAHS